MQAEVASLSAMNDRRVAFARSTGIPLDQMRLAWWCEQGHDMVTWLDCPGDDPRCWICGQPPPRQTMNPGGRRASPRPSPVTQAARPPSRSAR